MSTVIAVSGLSKKYVLGQQRQKDDGLRHVVEDALRVPVDWLRGRRGETAAGRKPKDFWALRDVSFDIASGEAVGIIGRNGSGKSTLLKMLSRITEPTLGEIRYRGRLASLLEVGTGFHPELTGRENIYLNAAILGMTRADIDRRFDEIVAFSEVEQFLDTPVKRYSSGMYVRLAFSVAAHIEPDILVIDEVLAVGDAAFQKKCLGRMGDVSSEGRTVLFVSHNMAAVAALCSKAMLLKHGRLEQFDRCDAVIDEYLRTAHNDADTPLAGRADRRGNGRVRFKSIQTLNDRGESLPIVSSGQDIMLEIDFEGNNDRPLVDVAVQVKFAGNVGQPLFACLSTAAQSAPLTLASGGRLRLRIPRLPLTSGVYTYTAWCAVGGVLEDMVQEAGKLVVAEGDFFGTGKLPPNTIGDFLVPHTWEEA